MIHSYLTFIVPALATLSNFNSKQDVSNSSVGRPNLKSLAEIINYFGVGSEYTKSPSYSDVANCKELSTKCNTVHIMSLIIVENAAFQDELGFTGLTENREFEETLATEPIINNAQAIINKIHRECWGYLNSLSMPNSPHIEFSEDVFTFLNGSRIAIADQAVQLNELTKIFTYISNLTTYNEMKFNGKEPVVKNLFYLLLEACTAIKKYMEQSALIIKVFRSTFLTNKLDDLLIEFMSIYDKAYLENSYFDISKIQLETDRLKSIRMIELMYQESVFILYLKSMMELVCNYKRTSQSNCSLITLELRNGRATSSSSEQFTVKSKLSCKYNSNQFEEIEIPLPIFMKNFLISQICLKICTFIRRIKAPK